MAGRARTAVALEGLLVEDLKSALDEGGLLRRQLCGGRGRQHRNQTNRREQQACCGHNRRATPQARRASAKWPWIYVHLFLPASRSAQPFDRPTGEAQLRENRKTPLKRRRLSPSPIILNLALSQPPPLILGHA